MLSLLKLQYVACGTLYSPSLLSSGWVRPVLLPLSPVPFLQNRQFKFWVGCESHIIYSPPTSWLL